MKITLFHFLAARGIVIMFYVQILVLVDICFREMEAHHIKEI
jgi:hypothetical protein